MLLEICFVVVLAIHLLAVNFGSAAPLACVWLDIHGRRSGSVAIDGLGRRLAVLSLLAMSFGVLLGLVMLGLLWQMNEQSYLHTLARMTADRYWVALGELVFYYVCMLWCVWLWKHGRGSIWRKLLAIVAATDVLYHFPPLMVTLTTIAGRSDLAGQILDRVLYRAVVLDPEVISRVSHAWLSSLAVTGVALAGCSVSYGAAAGEAEPLERVAMWGARLALAATLMQMVVGAWVLVELPAASRDAMMGDDALAASLLIAGLAVTFALLHSLLAIALGDTATRTVVRSIVLTAAVVLLMAGALRRVTSLRVVRAGGTAQYTTEQREDTESSRCHFCQYL